MGCGADVEANELLISLLAGKEFIIPEVDFDDPEYEIPDLDDLYPPAARITNEDLTTKEIDGSGTFDYMMSAFAVHLRREFDADRITGDDYTKAYVQLGAAAMQNATAFLLGKDEAYWKAVTARLQAQSAQIGLVTARVALETAKVQLQVLVFEALDREANYALTKIKLATESANYCIAQFNLEELLPVEKLLKEEQINLYQQQVISYQRDAEVKAAKLFTDAWITQKTIDEGLLAPDGFTNAKIDEILDKLRLNNFQLV